MRSLLAAIVLSATAASSAYAQTHVISWAPSYAIGKSLKRLSGSYGGYCPLDALTDLGLQWWRPTADGSVYYEDAFDPITDDQVQKFIDAGHAHGVRVLMCVYNGNPDGGDWDWSVPRSAFTNHRDTLVASVMAEVDRLKLDGVDLDFEGDDNFDADKPAYVAFVSALAKRLHAEGKVMSVDSFADVYGAPDPTWWPDLLPVADEVNSMGYDEIGVNAPDDWAKYSTQKADAGANAAKLTLGMATSDSDWLGDAAYTQLKWAVKDGSVGVALWDGQLQSPAWRDPRIWKKLSKIRLR